MVTVTADRTRLRFDPATARLTVHRGDRELLSGRIRATLGGTTYPDADAASVTSDEYGAEVVYDDGANTTVTFTAADGGVGVRVAVENTGAEPLTLGRLCPLADADGAFGPETQVYRNGYQSWSPTGTLPVGGSFAPVSDENRPMMTDLAAPGRTSHGLLGLRDEADLTLGFLDHSDYVTRVDFAADDGPSSVTAVCPGDGVAVAPGETVASATLRVDATRPLPEGIAAVADGVAERMGARVGEWTPTGWCSWYHYFTGVTADDVRENLDDIDAADIPIDVVQVDDGYQVAFGDWRTLADGFEDMAALADDIRAAGYTPGLWLAPFYVQEDATLLADHPDWFVRQDGDLVDAGDRHGRMFGLDLTHPEVQDWLTDTFTTIVDDWGFDYLKLDFLYAGALPGDRHADVTRARAYQTGLRTIREAVGDETFVLGCGAPQCQSVGLVDAMRVGPDTAEHWRDRSDCEPAHENALRNVLNRHPFHRRWWVNDPDCQLVRETTDLTRAERRTFAAVVALTGGSNVVSDRLAETDAWGRELFARSLPPVDGGRVEGIGDREFPERLVCARGDGGRTVALLNWADEPRERALDLAADERGWLAWDGQRVPAGGTAERTVPAHGCLLVQVAPARERPHLLGTAHLAGLGDRIETGWADGELSITLDADRPQDLVIAVPDGWHHPDGETVHATATPGVTTFGFEQV